MIALDTNVLVRFLVEDDLEQSKKARHLIQRIVSSGNTCFLSDIIICEMIWVMDSCYKIEKIEIVRMVHQLLASPHVTFATSDRIASALAAYETGPGDFSDYLIREHAIEAGCEFVSTFDKALFKEAGFKPL
jgi:Predicted nucleic-acid-binding protein, contains PIN domain